MLCNKKNIRYIDNNDFRLVREDSLVRDSRSSKVYISLTTTPSRIHDIENVLESLNNQVIRADKIYLSVCNKYKRKFTELGEKDIEIELNNVEIIKTTDYGPATKLLGILEHNEKENFLNEGDQIIVVDDDIIYTDLLVFSHKLCRELYQCDIVAVNEKEIIKSWTPYEFNNHDVFYIDNYKGYLYGWLSFSIIYNSNLTKEIFKFYKEQILLNPDIFYHDDLLFTLYSYKYNLHVVENRFITIRNARTNNDSLDALRNLVLNDHSSKYILEEKVYKQNNINSNFSEKKTNYFINKELPPRQHVLIKNMHIHAKYNENIHVLFTYIDEYTFMITVSVFDDKLINTDHEIIFEVGNNSYSILLNIEGLKYSHIVRLTQRIIPLEHSKTNHKIIQSNKTNRVSRNKFYAMMTLLNNAPEYEYIFFDDTSAREFIKNNYSDIIYQASINLIPGAYFCDIFRYCYLYIEGGAYFDCKKIMYIPLCKMRMINSKDIYIEDCIRNYSYNAIMICRKNSEVIKRALLYSVFNIIKNNYGADPLSITGPSVLGKAIESVYGKYVYHYCNTIPVVGKGHLSRIIDRMTRDVIIKNTYYGYYEEGNYINTNHYHVLWHKKGIYYTNLISKYNYIKSSDEINIF